MDELEIDGKKYLSSRKAAKDHKYHTDYIGQLIRAGKIVGRKVGRAWYVEAGSLDAYLTSESGASTIVTPTVPKVEIVPESFPEVLAAPAQPISVTASIAQPEPTPEPIVAEKVVEEKIMPRHEEPIRITIAEREIPQRKNTLTYIEDNEPLLPVLEGRARKNADFVPVSVRRSEPAVPQAQEQEKEELTAEEPQITIAPVQPRLPLVRASMLVALAITTFVFVGGVASLIATSIQVKDGQPASVAFTIK